MSIDDYKLHYRRNLPHFQPKGAIIFITFRLAGSIPQQLLIDWKTQQQRKTKVHDQIENLNERNQIKYDEWKRQFGRYDKYLDSAQFGPKWLGDFKIAQIVVDALHHLDNKKYRLDAFSIMPNHVHAVFAPLQSENGNFIALSNIMRGLKGFTAKQANQILERTGRTFWQSESYDHVIRDEGEWHRIMYYVLNNPAKAGLVSSWEDWRWSYCKYM